MPITQCPHCDKEFGADDGLFILPIEPYSATTMLFGDDERKGREIDVQSRAVRRVITGSE